MSSVSDLRGALVTFLQELDDELGDPHRLERVLRGDESLTGRDLGSEPESWTEEILIHPVIEAVGLNKSPGRPTSQRKSPDFKLVEEKNGDTIEIIGESKPLNNSIGKAERELVDDYISRKSFSEFGIATDGINWVVYRGERGGDFYEYDDVRRLSLSNPLLQLARENNFIGQRGLDDVDAVDEVDVDEELERFALVFKPEFLIPLLTQEAPANFRDRRESSVDDFFELYIELLFGESDEYTYETCLRNEIQAPPRTPAKDKDVFAVTLVNRLLFIRFLEEREVIPPDFLSERIDHYDDDLRHSLYKLVIEPLFYELFNKPKPDEVDDPSLARESEYTGGWCEDVPYLNGGLFRPNVDRERRYDVGNTSLIQVIDKLIEGNHGINLDLDPAILGSVFEQTINHISAEEGHQKKPQRESGAYYTPNDVTRLVNSQAVDPRVKRTIVDAFAGVLEQPEEARADAATKTLEELLSDIEEGRGYWGRTEGLERAKEDVMSLTILDPACGSGHFLTAAMEEIFQVVLSIHRGEHNGNDPTDQQRYEYKREIALESVYGVDVNRVATEIAKLRVWLKIVEGNKYQNDWAQLPNIDVNIMSGNSLVGFPTLKTEGNRTLHEYEERIDELLTLREEYKREDMGEKEEIVVRTEALREDLNAEYVQRLNTYVDAEIPDAEAFLTLVDSVQAGDLDQTVEQVRVKPSDGRDLTASDEDFLERLGFRPFTKSARLDIGPRMEDLQDRTVQNGINSRGLAGEAILYCLAYIVGSEYDITEVRRRPIESDLDSIEGHTFHWIAEFPEVREGEGVQYNMIFDIVVGNPPYGDILNEYEKMLVAEYETGSINEVAAQFVERQLQLLRVGGFFGNIHAQRILYQGSARDAREVLRQNLVNGHMACFGHRPSTVFGNANPRAAITTGEKAMESETHDFFTSAFILFHSMERDAAFRNIEYESIEGLILGDYIGDAETNNAYPKVGSEMSRSILLQLKEESDRQYVDVITRDDDEATDHVVWRNRHPLYWMNPFLEDLYTQHPSDEITQSDDFEQMYFEDELERHAGFIILQSSLFYHYWSTYANQMDLNWGPIEAFPFPTRDDLEPVEEEIHDLSDQLWHEMRAQFDGTIPNGALLKPTVDEIDDLIGPMYGLDDEQIEWIKDYHTEFGRAPDDSTTKDGTVQRQFSSSEAD